MKRKKTIWSGNALAVLSAGLLLLSFNSLWTAAAQQQPLAETIELSEPLRPELAQATLLAPMAKSARLDLTLAFKLPDRAALDAFISELHDERSPNYRRWLTPEQFGDRFGADRAHYQAARDWLRAQGFQVKREWPNRLMIDFSGTVAQIEKSFATNINTYAFRGHNYFAHARAPRVPREFADAILTVMGMENFSEPQPLHISAQRGAGAQRFTTGRATALSPKDFQTAYNAGALLAAGIDGRGQTIAIAARSDFNISDVQRFRTAFNLPANDPQKLFPFGAVSNLGGIEETEVLLDVQLAGAVAPGATVQAVIAPKLMQSLQSIYNDRPNVPIVSVSFGLCEQRLTTESVKMFDALYAQGVVQGQTTFVASGDNGANDCRDGRPAVNGLASSPNVTAVGGTKLNPLFDSNGNATGYGGEEVWNSGGAVGGGGGASIVFEKPLYQFGPGVLNDGRRNLPDVSLLADLNSPGYFIVEGGQVVTVGGTSAAAPCWAGALALVEQFTGSGPLGNINFRIYALGANQANGGPVIFNDITLGDNSNGNVSGFKAGPNYDLATGWGSVNIDALARNFFTQRNNLSPVRDLQGGAQSGGAIVLNWQPPVQSNQARPVIDLAELANETVSLRGLEGSEEELEQLRYGVVHARTSASVNPNALVGMPPEITSLTVMLKNKNKALANFQVMDGDADLGRNGAVSILLFDNNLKPVIAARNGNLLPFNDKDVFPKGLDFSGQMTGSFPFTLKGVKNNPTASIWVSSLRDNAGNLSLAPGIAGIAGRASGGSPPQIGRTLAAIFSSDDTVGVDLDGNDPDGDTIGMTLSFLDDTGNVRFALGLVGERQLQNFAPFPLDLVRSPVRGRTTFNINFAISGIAREVPAGTLRGVAVSLVDSQGNRSAMRVIPFGMQEPKLLRYNIYRSTSASVRLAPANLIASVPADVTTFTDRNTPAGSTSFFYVVTAVYDRGESPVSNEIAITTETQRIIE